jgi:diguanylate cyclase (GGDEF)-like protein
VSTDPILPAVSPLPPTVEIPGWIGGDDASQMRVLDSVAQFTHHRDTDALDHSLTLSLAELADAQSVTLYKRDGDRGGPEESLVRCARNAQGRYAVSLLPCESDASAQAMLRQGERDGGCVRLRDGNHGMLVPIRREGRMIGALMLESSHPLEHLRPLVEGFARIYANYIGLLDESERDKLTGLYNRRSFDRHLNRRLHGVRARDPEAPSRIWLAIVDIDHFKRINDTLGHLYGDEVILVVAQLMRACFRQGDALFRFGGEEFVALFSATDEATVHGVLERFRVHVARFPFPLVGHVTISIGYSRIGAHDYPVVALDRADQALYHVKQHGRDGVRGYEELDASGALTRGQTAGTIDLF